MQRPWLGAVRPVFVCLLALFGTSTAFAGKFVRADKPAPGAYLVQLQKNTDADDDNDGSNGNNGNNGKDNPKKVQKRIERATQLGQRYHVIVKDVFSMSPEMISIQADDDRATQLAADSDVAFVMQDGEFGAFSGVTVGDDQWNLDRIDQHLGLDHYYNWATPTTPDPNGAGVRVYVIDDGFSTEGSMFHLSGEAYNAVSKMEGFLYDLSGHEYNLYDGFSHGTKVASLIAGTYQNHHFDPVSNTIVFDPDPTKGYGVARGATIVPIRTALSLAQLLDSTNPNGSVQDGTITVTLRALDWVQHRPNKGIVNLSISLSVGKNTQQEPHLDGTYYFGDPQIDLAVRNKLKDLVDAGFFVVLGSGNAGADACRTPWTPAGIEKNGLIVVGASDRNDARSIWSSLAESNRGSCVEIWAPGTATNAYGGPFDGTSAATPHVSGVAALLWNGQSDPGQLENAIKLLASPVNHGDVTSVLTVVPKRRACCTVIQNPPVPPPNPLLAGDATTLTVTVFPQYASNAVYEWYAGTAGDANNSVKVGNNSPMLTIAPQQTTPYWVRVHASGIQEDSNAAVVQVTTRAVTSLMLSTSTLCPGDSAVATITLDGPAGSAGTAVSISSTSPSIQVPAQITVPAGATSATFVVTSVSGPFFATSVITASTFAGGAHAQITAQAAVASISVIPSALSGGTSAIGTVTLTGPAPAAGQVVMLTSGDPTSVVVPPSVTIPGGVFFATFPITTKPKTTQQNVAITGTVCNTRAAAVITVYAVPCTPVAVTVQPQSSTIEAGRQATLTIGVSGSPSPSIQWFDGLGFFAGSGPSIAVSPAVTTTYTATVSNFCSSQRSAPATVTVICNLATITSQPQSTNITAGGTATLSVTVTGTTPLALQWYRADGTPLVGETSTTLRVSPSSDTGYFVRVSNACNSTTSTTATVTVCQPASITVQPKPASIRAGDTATLTVAASGSAPLSYQWFLANGTALSGETSSTLRVTPQNDTSYFVRVSNACNTATSTIVTVTVCHPASITVQPQPASITLGGTATLTVAAAGSAPLAYQWFLADGTPIAGETSDTLHVSPASNTSYFVRVSNACNTATSTIAAVSVCVPAQIASGPNPVTIVAGDTAQLSVTAAGTAPFAYQWFLADGTQLAGESAATLRVAPTATTSYFARVTNACGTIASAVATSR